MDLPTGFTEDLEGSESATLQIHSSDGDKPCYTTTFGTVIKNEVDFCKAK